MRELARNLLLVGAAGLLASCAGAGPGRSSAPGADPSGLPTDRPVKEADLTHLPGVRVYYPGSRRVADVAADQTATGSGEEPNPAYVGAVLVATATPGRLYAWYGRWLEGRGYRPATSYRPASQTSGRAWQLHKRIQVQVGVFDPALLASEMNVTAALRPGEIAYEEVLVGYPPGLPKA